ncbi:EutP/PduV family microcompartment system protein [Streptococcus cuniculi]|uniref:EutP/PduV family microcompartment system protein n=1 Tax=Streptococcus cuniculi TaxID=1432788 RepID=A0A4Y9JFJ9_9STRE|nr:EutP/PduV family microcompartment system protein [Streptococcus cuniculi]MBF0777614.1 EutP/PduV family microcompartment system protein [Streptococcus cuniculi]TFU98654.1 EutP/PduV family microcompartment system protein [Streptococcus cuniculi]
MKKIMFVGSVGVGKTTLTQRLKGLELNYYKTQAIQFYDAIIDTPGEFLQHRKYYNALTVTAAEADVIGLLVSVVDTMQTFPQGFSSLFTKPVVGVITKIDMAEDDSKIDRARQQLKQAGALQIFEISAVENKGIAALEEYLREE